MRDLTARLFERRLLSKRDENVVKDATGQSLAYVYARETRDDADTAKVLTMDETRRIASNIAKLPTLLGAADPSELDFPEGGG